MHWLGTPPAFCRALFLLVLASMLGSAPDARAQGAPPDSAAPDQQKQAQQRYEQGVQHYKEGRFADAAEAFRSSYEIVASPNSRLMYGRALRESGKLENAYEELALAQQEASELAIALPKYASAGESAEAEAEALLKRVAVLRVEVKGAERNEIELSVGERTVPPQRWRAIAVKPGTYEIQARVAGASRVTQTAQATLGQITRVVLDVGATATAASDEAGGALGAPEGVPAGGTVEHDRGTPQSDHPLRPWAFVAGGIGLVGFATFAVAGSMSQKTFSDLEDECPNKTCPAELQDDIDRGKGEQMVANVGLIVGAVGVTAGVALFVIDLGSAEATRRGSRVRVGVGPRSVSVAGSF
jgi:hypothetical protein